MIGYNAAGPNWLYVPVDANGYLMVDCMAGCTGGGGGELGTLANDLVTNNSSNTAAKTINPQADVATQLEIIGEPPASVTAGSGLGVTVVAEDAQGNVQPIRCL